MIKDFFDRVDLGYLMNFENREKALEWLNMKANRFAYEACVKSLAKAAENARIRTVATPVGYYTEINKETITDPQNIVL